MGELESRPKPSAFTQYFVMLHDVDNSTSRLLAAKQFIEVFLGTESLDGELRPALLDKAEFSLDKAQLVPLTLLGPLLEREPDTDLDELRRCYKDALKIIYALHSSHFSDRHLRELSTQDTMMLHHPCSLSVACPGYAVRQFVVEPVKNFYSEDDDLPVIDVEAEHLLLKNRVDALRDANIFRDDQVDDIEERLRYNFAMAKLASISMSTDISMRDERS